MQDEGKCAFAASCFYSISLIRHQDHLKADEQRQGERNANVARHKREKRDLKYGCWRCLCPKTTWWFKHWGLKRSIASQHSSWTGPTRKEQSHSEDLWGNKSHRGILTSHCGACSQELFSSFNGAHERLNSSCITLVHFLQRARCFLTETCILSQLLST